MKKITLSVLVLCLALPVFAGDVDDATFTVSGNASVTFGVDLESNATGFDNGSAADFVLNFGVPTTALKSGSEDGAIYGQIAFKDIRVELEEDDIVDANIALDYAKIMGANWWLSVTGPDAAIDYENALQNGIIGIAAAWDGQADNVSNTVASSGGFEFGISVPDVAAIELSLFSLTDWTSTSANAQNAYGMKASASLSAVENLTFEAALNMGFGSDFTEPVAATDAVYDWIDDDDDDTTAPVWGVATAAAAASTSALNSDVGIGGKLAYAIAVNDDITITPEIGADVKLVADGANIAIGNGLRVTLAGSEITAAEDGIKDDAGNSLAWDDGVNSGLTLGWSYYMPAVGDAALDLQAHVGISAVENLQVALGFEAADILDDTADMGIAAYASYAIGDIKPWGGLFMIFDGKMVANAGLTWSNIVPLTTLTVEWRSGDLSLTDPDLGIAKVTAKVSY